MHGRAGQDAGGSGLAPEHRRGHGSLYGGLNEGRLDFARLRRTLMEFPLPRAADGRLVLAADVSPWLRPDAATAPDRSFCHTYGRGEGKHQMIPGWPYSVIAALETGRTSWTAPLDAVRLEPGADVAAVTTAQIRELVERLVAAGQWTHGDPDILIVLDAGYDALRIAHLLDGLPVEILGRMRSDRVLRRPTPARVYDRKGGQPPKHGGEFVFGDPDTWGTEQAVTVTGTRLYGKATAQAWDRLHLRLTKRAAWLDHDGPLPIIEGTVIRLHVQHIPSGGDKKPVWLWWSKTGATTTDVDHCWQSYLRRFDLEHTFRMIKQTLGWTKPRLRSPQAADRWTWLVIVTHTQLGSPGPWPSICAGPGRNRPSRTGSPRHVSAGGSETCARRPQIQHVRRNLPGPARGAHRVRRTALRQYGTTSDASSPPVRHTPARPTTRRAPSHDARSRRHSDDHCGSDAVRSTSTSCPLKPSCATPRSVLAVVNAGPMTELVSRRHAAPRTSVSSLRT